MKKILLTAALTGLIAGYAAADSNVVSSANIVGYVQTETPPAGSFDIVSLVQFSDGSNTVHIQDAIGNLSNLNASATWDNADKLITWNGGYATYGLYQPASGGPYWMAAGAAWAVPALASPADTFLERGKALWFKTASTGSSTNMTVSGDVFLDESFTVDLPEGFSILSYPYSSSINLTNLVISNATASATWADADKVIVWNGGYVTYGLYQPASGSPYWMAAGAAWAVPALAAPTSANIELGKGFWYRSMEAKTIGFSKIYSID